jgi:hypothetical protein
MTTKIKTNTRKALIQALSVRGLTTPVLEARPTITDNEAFVVLSVFKVGPPAAIAPEIAVYGDLEARLGRNYEELFPTVVVRHNDAHTAVFEMPWLGRSLMSAVFEPLAWGEWVTVLARSPDEPRILGQLALADETISHAIQFLETLFAFTHCHNLALADRFVTETLSALRANLLRARLLPELEAMLSSVEESRTLWAVDLEISCCHRDLTTDHIYLVVGNSPLMIRFADPRALVPHAEETPFGTAHPPSSLGSIAVDFAHLEVSLARHRLELTRIAPSVHLVALERVRTRVRDWISRKRFSHAFYELALATWYANYAGWPPALGNAPPPDKQWLHEHMISEARSSLTRCAALARS